MDDPSYVPPPAFAPPALRVAPLNEAAVLGGTSYPHGPYAQLVSYAPPAYPPTTWYPPAEPKARRTGSARRRRRLSILTAVAVAAALVVVGIASLSSSSAPPSRSLSLPSSVDSYTRVSTLSGTQVRGMFSAGGGTFGVIPLDDLAAARVGIYAEVNDNEPSLLFVGFSGHDSPSIGAQLRTGPADAVAENVLDGAGATTGPKRVDAGPLGGAMRCAVLDVDGESASVGVWADRDTLGIVLIIDPTIAAHTTAPTTAHTSLLTRDFRAAAEH